MNKQQALAAIKAGRKMGLALDIAPLTSQSGEAWGSTLWGIKCGFTADGPRIFWTREDLEAHARQHAGRHPAICG